MNKLKSNLVCNAQASHHEHYHVRYELYNCYDALFICPQHNATFVVFNQPIPQYHNSPSGLLQARVTPRTTNKQTNATSKQTNSSIFTCRIVPTSHDVLVLIEMNQERLTWISLFALVTTTIGDTRTGLSGHGGGGGN